MKRKLFHGISGRWRLCVWLVFRKLFSLGKQDFSKKILSITRLSERGRKEDRHILLGFVLDGNALKSPSKEPGRGRDAVQTLEISVVWPVRFANGRAWKDRLGKVREKKVWQNLLEAFDRSLSGRQIDQWTDDVRWSPTRQRPPRSSSEKSYRMP